MQIEFGDKCCFISMDNEDKGEIYGFINSVEDGDEIIDLYANCYPKNRLCYAIADVLKIIRTFIQTGAPDSNYAWDISDM